MRRQPIATDCKFVGVKCVDAGFAAGKLAGIFSVWRGHGSRSAKEWPLDTMEMPEKLLLSMGTEIGEICG